MLAAALAVLMLTDAPLAGDVRRPQDSERAGLMALYEATGGPRWKKSSGWGSEATICDWYGVICQSDETGRHVAGLNLDDNGLKGQLPADLLERLPLLEVVDVPMNELSGPVPEAVLARWDRSEIEFNGRGNNFSNLLKRIRLRYVSTGTLCAPDEDVDYSYEVREDGSARFESVRCKPGTDRGTQCLVREGYGPDLARLSRALRFVEFSRLGTDYDHPFWAVTHAAYVTTTAWFGDNSSWSLKTYDRQGPVQAWIAQSLFLALPSDTGWSKESVQPRCSKD